MSNDSVLTYEEAALALKTFYDCGGRATAGMIETIGRPGPARTPMVPIPREMLEARAQGRAEALALLLGVDIDTFCGEYIASGGSLPSGELDEGWNDKALRELLRADDTAWSLLEAAEGEYWSNLGFREEAELNYALSKSVANTAVIDAALTLVAAARDGSMSSKHVYALEEAVAIQRGTLRDNAEVDARDHTPASAPSFEAKHLSLKQKGGKIILTLELDGVEGAPRYFVTPINPAVVRGQIEPDTRTNSTLAAGADQ